jgi:hypothetical protein
MACIIFRKTSRMVRQAKRNLGLRVTWVYTIPCECGKVYVMYTDRSSETTCKERTRHLHVYQPDKSTVAEHSIELGHQIKFKDTELLGKPAGYKKNVSNETSHGILPSA